MGANVVWLVMGVAAAEMSGNGVPLPPKVFCAVLDTEAEAIKAVGVLQGKHPSWTVTHGPVKVAASARDLHFV